jgi:hypothetical protein
VTAVLNGPGEVLADLDIRDPEFTDWLRDLRQAFAEAQPDVAAPQPVGRGDGQATILVRQSPSDMTHRAAFLASMIRTRIEQEMAALGDVTVVLDRSDDQEREAKVCSLVELESIEDDGRWFLMLRVYGLPSRRMIWTGRLSLPLEISKLWNTPEVLRLTNQAVGVLSDQVASRKELTPSAAIHKAVRRIYDFEVKGLAAADELLRQVEAEDETGLVQAWRGFVGLTAALEYRDASPDLEHHALGLVDAALARESPHPVCFALASQVHMRLGGDPDRARYMAERAVAASDANPYALDALALAASQTGDAEGAYRAALQARRAAEGLAHAFAWDMQCCLSALGLDRMDDALAHAVTSHRLMPYYRPPLRYLVALSLLLGRPADTDHYALKLQRLEGDFTAGLLLQPDYPVHTLRALGYVERLRSDLG